MAKQLSVNEWKYLVLKNTKNNRSGELTKKCFLNDNDENKKCRITFLTINERD
nr:hypothetical protein [Mycoplasmopsis bovis]